MYNKLFTKIVDSSIWLESTPTRLLWMMFIAVMDEDGFCQFACIENVSSRARLSIEETREAIKTLESPDKRDPLQEFEGRRIERVPGGWMVLNSSKYREMVTREVARERTRQRVAKHRAEKRKVAHGNAPVTHSNGSVTPSEAVSGSEAEKTNTDTSCLDAERLVGVELEELKDRLLRELPVNPLAPTELEFRTFVYQNCPLLNKLRGPTLWYDMHGFYQWKGNKWIPVQDWKKYVTSLEEKKFKSNPRCKI